MLKKKPKPYPDLVSEVSLGFLHSNPSKQKIIIGVDEVDVVALQVLWSLLPAVLCADRVLELGFLKTGKRSKRSDHTIHKLQDSKLIPESQREMFRDVVDEFVLGSAIGEASVEEIGELNILYASHLAMDRAVAKLEKKLKIKADWILVDGHLVPKVFKDRGVPLIKGDQKSLTIACASIVAKVHRDQMMAEMEAQYPGYGLEKHKGYPTPFHKKQIQILGITPIHRLGFKGVVKA